MKNKEGWEKKTIDDCFETIRNGANIKQNDIHSGIPITRIETISNSIFNRDRLGYANIVNSNDYSKYILNDGDILMSHINSLKYLGRAVLYKKDNNEKIIHGMNLLILIAKREIIKPQYITYYFCSEIFKSEIYRIAKKSVNQASFTTTDLKKIRVSIPPLTTQHQIVSELDTLSDIISKKKQQIEELDKLAQATFYDMFGDPVTNEKGLTVKNLGEICEITSSKRIYAEEYQQEGIPFYRSKEIIEKGKKKPISLELFISNERYNEIKNKFGIPEIGDILMTAVGTIGEIWVVDSDTPFYFKDGNIVWLKMNKSNNSTYFLFVLGLLVKEYKTKMAVGAAYSALTIVNLKNMKVVYPVLEVQNQFATKIESIEKQKSLINQSIGDVQQLFDYTMDKYFN